jgi:hypothetical protein
MSNSPAALVVLVLPQQVTLAVAVVALGGRMARVLPVRQARQHKPPALVALATMAPAARVARPLVPRIPLADPVLIIPKVVAAALVRADHRQQRRQAQADSLVVVAVVAVVVQPTPAVRVVPVRSSLPDRWSAVRLYGKALRTLLALVVASHHVVLCLPEAYRAHLPVLVLSLYVHRL